MFIVNKTHKHSRDYFQKSGEKKKKKGKERGKKQKKEREGVERGKGRKGEGWQLGIKASVFFSPLSFGLFNSQIYTNNIAT